MGVYTFVRTGIPQNAPPDLADGGKVYVVAGNSAVALRQKIVSVYGVEYNRTQNDPSSAWRAWTKTALATPPQEFDLPLADGWSGWAKYSKDQFGRVLVYGLVAKSTALISGDVIGTLPEGFRPSATCPMTITSGNASDGKSFATSGYVQPSGALTLSNGTISSVYKLGNNLAFNFVFPAAS